MVIAEVRLNEIAGRYVILISEGDLQFSILLLQLGLPNRIQF